MMKMKEELSHGLDAEFYDELMDGEIDDLPLWRVLLSATTGPSLEIGCGTGRVMLPLLQEGYRIDGIDSSAKMIELLNDKALGLGVETNVQVQSMEDLDKSRDYSFIFYPRFFYANGCYP
jgi:2-polyprenyl-3-methyl-5-hydroxy-6-metoxy-1,4-benzoquinol methylase